MRFSVLALTAASALLTLVGASPASVDEQSRVCVPALCMGLAVIHSDCVDPMSPGPVIPDVANPKSVLTQCVCADEELKKAYLSCYGFCEIDEATEPFCGASVKRDVEEASLTEIDAAHPEITATAELDDGSDVHENYRISNFINFCGVPGQACGEKMVETDTASAERADPTISAERRESTVSAARRRSITHAARSPITLAPEVVNVEKRGSGRHTLPNFINFCGVPGQACGEKIAVPTAAPGDEFEDVGHVGDEELEGKIGHDSKRDGGHVPTTLQIMTGHAVAPSWASG